MSHTREREREIIIKEIDARKLRREGKRGQKEAKKVRKKRRDTAVRRGEKTETFDRQEKHVRRGRERVNSGRE